MWFEYVLVGGAVALSLLWLFRHFTKPSHGGCDGCDSPSRPPLLQRDIPDFRETK